MITLYDNGAHLPLLWTHLIPSTLEGKALHNVQNAMFAAGMAWSMGVSLDSIRHGLRTFDMSFYQAPGRMNVFDELGFKVILDYGHNPAAVDAMCVLVDELAPPGKRVCVLSAPGDRRDEDIVAIARRAARSFDRFICRQDDDPRGRAPGEVSRLLATALVEAGADEDRVEIVNSEELATERGLSMCVPGDLLLLFGDNIKRTWKQIIYFGGRKPQDESVSVAAYAAEPAVAAAPAAPAPESPVPVGHHLSPAPGFALLPGGRGVRVASEPEVGD